MLIIPVFCLSLSKNGTAVAIVASPRFDSCDATDPITEGNFFFIKLFMVCKNVYCENFDREIFRFLR